MIDGDKLIDLMVGTKLRDDEWPVVRDIIRELVAENDRIQSAVEEQGAEIKKLRAALRHYVDECLNCNGEGAKPEYDPILGKSLWCNCVVCTEARAALEEK